MQQTDLAETSDSSLVRQEELRHAFDKGRLSGLQLKNDSQHPLTTSEIARLLRASKLPCIGGNWQEVEREVWLYQRLPCQFKSQHFCQIWRESVDGLVMGAGDHARYSRHSQFLDPGHGCVDVLYPDSKAYWRWTDLPEAFQGPIEELQAELARHQAELKILGYAERQVFYQLQDRHPHLAGHRQGFLKQSLQHQLTLKGLELQLVDMSPTAVWSED